MSDSRHEAAAVEQSPQQRQRARIAGWLMASTFLTSIPAALILYDPVLNDTDYILGAGDDTRVTLGALLEIFLMIGNVGTAVVMFPILRRYSETLSLSYVASRHDRVDDHRGRRDQPALRRHPARRPGRVHRRGRNLARHRGADPGRDPRLDVPVRAGILRRRQRAGRPARALLDPRGRLRGGVRVYLIVKGFRPSGVLADATR